MKIAYVYDAVYPWVKGGAEKRVYELSRGLPTGGMRFTALGSNGGRAIASSKGMASSFTASAIPEVFTPGIEDRYKRRWFLLGRFLYP